VKAAMNQVCEALTSHGLVLKFFCSDGGPGYHDRDTKFFASWIDIFLENGLEAAVDYARGVEQVPVGDFLHLWKTYCSRVKNHLVTLTPDSVENAVKGEDLEALLGLGEALTDKSSVGKTRDSYVLQLFSLENRLNCLGKGSEDKELMDLLPWALQEEVICSQSLTPQERLTKAIVSRKLFVHYFLLSFFPCAMGVSQRFQAATTPAVIFAETSQWHRILNLGLGLIVFIMDGDATWSFSRLGTHCLQNFFGLTRQNSRGDDVFSTALLIIARTCVGFRELHELGLQVEHHGHDNLGGTPTGPGFAVFRPDYPEMLCQSFVSF
jgi:hypothetical protein